MARSTERIENEMLALSHEERARLAHKLIVSLDEGVREDVEDYWKEELVRRDRQIEAGEDKLIPVEQALKSARRRLDEKQ